TVTVSDNTAPTFNETLPEAEITAECDAVVEADVLTASDNCDSDVPVVFTETRTDGDCANSYTLTRTWTATDNCDNETSFTQTVTVSDNTAPTFNETLPEAEITAECDAVVEADVLTASDNCDSDVPVVFTETRTDGDCANSYTLTRTWTATDNCGNETSFTQTVIVSDNTAPVVTCNDITVQLDANGVATITVDDINAGTTDACSGIDTMFISQETFFCGSVGENVVTLTAIDECGNEATCTAIVTVEEGEADCGFDPFNANDDILTLIYCPGGTVSGNLDLFANDEGSTRENVSFTILSDLPNGVSVTDGNLAYVNEDPTEAVITFTYSVCHTVNTENCDTAEVTIQVLLDSDCDGVPDNDDIDDDDDGILDIIEEENALDQTSLDSDGDGIVDRLDIDSDNDGIVDNIEWQSTIAEDGEYDYILPSGTDSNGDGWDDAYDPANNGITYEPWDMDLDGTPDYLDTNTDNEGEDDNIEGWDEFPNDSIADVSFIGNDADRDGLDDAYDTYNAITEGWSRGLNATGSDAYLQDTDNDGVRDWRDAVDDRTPPEQFACGEPVIPNAFSPNQDGYNDYFKVMIYCTGDQGGSEERVLGDDYTNARIEIFNRWGNLVYEKERYGNEDYWGDVDAWWDGTSMHDMQVGNEKLPTATYYYILYFNDGSKEPITGFIFLNN
ncbi:gliding motility-associated C-terminal domain-containing protein, partial [Draconibacterium sp.]|uniref:T9SS type B sorting domain-containing protein n=1 Tax=Draconibacterium sp. TaxID=1965318 RepID=UPI003566C4D9